MLKVISKREDMIKNVNLEITIKFKLVIIIIENKK